MAQRITLAIVIEHIQAMKNDLQGQINRLDTGLKSLTTEMRQEFAEMRYEMHRGFDEARQHRQALQEDLHATMRLQGKHQSAIARLTKKHGSTGAR